MTQPISSVATGPRQTNIEILRILAMFMVLMVHADFWSLGAPAASELQTSFISALARIIIESFSIVCVNVFIFISGWFTIKSSLKGCANFLFQCGFFLIGIYLVMLLTGQADLTVRGIAGCFALTHANWFIRAYLGLYILSPVLNTFVEKASKSQLGWLLVSFYVFQTVYGFFGAASFIAHGYSTFSFIGLYLLAQFIKRYVKVNYRLAGLVYIICVLLLTGMQLACFRFPCGISVYAYDNPLVVLGAVSLFLFFNGLNIKYSAAVNYIAKSSFAVFLLHTNPNIGEPVFIPICRAIFRNYSGWECLGVFFVVLTVIFFTAIVLDFPRRLLWRFISGGKKL